MKRWEAHRVPPRPILDPPLTKKTFNCNSKMMIHLIECKVSGEQYNGSTGCKVSGEQHSGSTGTKHCLRVNDYESIHCNVCKK